MHNILQEYVVLRFHDAPAQIKNKISGIAGRWEKAKCNNRAAVSHFYRAKMYDELLSCNLNNMLMEDFSGVAFSQIALDVYLHCNNEILAKHPISALKICYALYAAAKFDEYTSFLERLHSIIFELNSNQLLGEWTLVSAFEVFPDITKMTAV
jgi:ATP/maltotriose-dependent transcriptional regulator MalT